MYLWFYKGALKTYITQPTIKERGEEAHMRSALQGLPQWWRHDSRRCACMWARPRPSALSHPLAGKWFVFALKKKMKKQLGTKRWQVVGVLSLLSSLSFSFSPSLSLPLSLYLSPLFLFLSLFVSLSLSLRFSLSLSLSVSLSLKGHTHVHRKTVESMLILTVGPLTLHPTASTWVGEIRGA